MDKRKVNNAIPYAYTAIEDAGMLEDGIIDKTYRGQISSFGAAVTMGSLLPAVAFFSDKGSAKVDRTKLMTAILITLKKQEVCAEKTNNLFEFIQNEIESGVKESVLRENILNACIAIKLAMNLYTFKKREEEK